MLGCYDFCGHYEWTFAWLHREGGHDLVRAYWDEAIHGDSQRHAAELISEGGIEGMARYWGHTLADEAAGHHTTVTDRVFRVDMHQCPSKGFLLRNGLEQYPDYCDHCMGWIGPMLRASGWTVDHEHNHHGQCWWEIRRMDDRTAPGPAGGLSGEHDVRLLPTWNPKGATIDAYERANDPDDKSRRQVT
ncbi:MAG TPA: hypothetical protein PLU30_07750 [Verrucomicrobiae bacterium]|mgnify:CR=1 FL=1|nr:hypothetical protein [Verrucomicrobiae bacterium]